MGLSFVLRRSIALLSSFLSCSPSPARWPTPTPTATASTPAPGTTARVAPGSALRTDEDTFKWHGRMSLGLVLDVRDVNGDIEALPATGDDAEVVATKSGTPEARATVGVVVKEDGERVRVCVADRREENESFDCESRRSRRANMGDARVDFALRVPHGVRLVATTCNGSVSAASLDRPVELATVNGSIRATGVVPVHARTTNGSIFVSMPSHWDEDVELQTVNGNIELSVPDGSNAELVARAVHGGVLAHLPVTSIDSARETRIVLGRGGHAVSARTVNGTIVLGPGV